jgi:hypothetical protein
MITYRNEQVMNQQAVVLLFQLLTSINDVGM